MTNTLLRPRHWALAGLAGAYSAILPIAFGYAMWQARRTHEMLAESAQLLGPGDPPLNPALMAAQTFIAVAIVGSLTGLPVAALVAGLMALLERSLPAARTLLAWLAASVIGVLPVAIGFALLTDNALVAAPFLGFALLGGGVAWLVRHRRHGRLI